MRFVPAALLAMLRTSLAMAQEKGPLAGIPDEAAGGGEAASRTAKPYWGGEGKPSGQHLFFFYILSRIHNKK